jgi:hypothetical protein
VRNALATAAGSLGRSPFGAYSTGAARRRAHLAGDRLGGQRVVAGHHRHADAGAAGRGREGGSVQLLPLLEPSGETLHGTAPTTTGPTCQPPPPCATHLRQRSTASSTPSRGGSTREMRPRKVRPLARDASSASRYHSWLWASTTLLRGGGVRRGRREGEGRAAVERADDGGGAAPAQARRHYQIRSRRPYAPCRPSLVGEADDALPHEAARLVGRQHGGLELLGVGGGGGWGGGHVLASAACRRAHSPAGFWNPPRAAAAWTSAGSPGPCLRPSPRPVPRRTSSMGFSARLCRWWEHLVSTISGAPFIMITFLSGGARGGGRRGKVEIREQA